MELWQTSQELGGVVLQAFNIRTGEIYFAPDFRSEAHRESVFRALGEQGNLRCQCCKEAVILRHGNEHCPYFIHNAESECPQANQRIELLEARAALYRHLRERFGDDVQLEFLLPNTAAPRAIDCWVQLKDKKFAYWIFDLEMSRESKRRALRAAIEMTGAQCHFLFLAQMLSPIHGEPNAIRLSPTEKFAKARTRADVISEKSEAGSLCYLDVQGERAKFVTYRTLVKLRSKRDFVGVEKQSPLDEVIVCENSGLLLHRAESILSEILRTREERERIAHEEESAPQKSIDAQWAKWRADVEQSERTNESVREIVARILRKPPLGPTLWKDQEGTCVHCKAVTTDWISFNGKAKTCRCRKCFAKPSENLLSLNSDDVA